MLRIRNMNDVLAGLFLITVAVLALVLTGFDEGLRESASENKS